MFIMRLQLHSWRRALRFLTIPIVLIVALTLAQAQPTASPTTNPTPATPVVGAKAIGRSLPDFKISDTNGKKHSRDSLRGAPVALLFLSTTDAACLRTAERLLARLAQVENAKVIALVLDSDSTAPSTSIARSFKQEVIGTGGVRDRVIVTVGDSAIRSDVGRLIGADKATVADVPTLVVANSEGTITQVLVGEPNAEAIAEIWK